MASYRKGYWSPKPSQAYFVPHIYFSPSGGVTKELENTYRKTKEKKMRYLVCYCWVWGSLAHIGGTGVRPLGAKGSLQWKPTRKDLQLHERAEMGTYNCKLCNNRNELRSQL